MGLFIHLYVQPQSIDPAEWEIVYAQSLRLLHSFPVPLMRWIRERTHGEERWVYTTQLVEQQGENRDSGGDEPSRKEYWEVEGDLVTYRLGESFRFPRSLAKWQQDEQSAAEVKEILWADVEEIHYVSGNGVDLFGRKTQGYPFHLAMLAVGMLVENHFPERAYVIGDIERIQAEELLPWMQVVLGESFALPVCLDGAQLYQRLLALYGDSAPAIQRFRALFRGTEEEAMETLLKLAGDTVVYADFVAELAHYQSLSQLGAIGLVSKFLSVTQNLHQLIEIVLQIGKNKQATALEKSIPEKPSEEKPDAFSLDALLAMLCRKFVTIAPAKREPLLLFARSGEQMMTIQDSFLQVFMAMKGAPSEIDFYCNALTLEAIFTSYAPTEQEHFRQIIAAGTQACLEELAKVEELLVQMNKKSAQQPEAATSTGTATTGVDEITALHTTRALPEAEYILQQIYTQLESFAQEETVAQTFGDQLQTLMQRYPEEFRSTTVSDYLQKLARYSRANGVTLSQSAWQRIDQEQDLNVLRGLLTLCMVKEPSADFRRWRRHLLSQPKLWPYLAARPIGITG